MKKLYTLIAILVLNMAAFAQAPQKMSYQAVVRDAANGLIANQMVGMQISVLQGSDTGTPVYVETQTPTTNANGLASLEIGTGTIVSGTFPSINWSTGTYYIKIETDLAGGNTYTISGASQLLSVPYALYAGGSNGGLSDGSAVGNTPFWNGNSWVTNNSNIFNNGNNVGINTTTPERILEVFSDITYSAGQTASLMLSDNFQKWNLGLGYEPTKRFSISTQNQIERFVITETGNIGIGIINPLAKLDVDGQIKITDGTQGAGKVLTSDADGLATWTTPGSGSSNLADGTAVGNTTYWNGTDWVETSTLFSNGTNVGIGTTTPTSQFDIMGATESRSRFRYGSETAGLTIGNWANEAYVYNELNTDLVFGTNNFARVRIKNNGNVGIGTNTPGEKLHVEGNIAISNNGALETGKGVTKQTDAGKIAYQRFSQGLDIVGAGTTPNNRVVTIWSEGGTTIKGPITVNDGSQAAGKVLTSDANGLATWASPAATTKLADGTTVGNTPYWDGTNWTNNSNTIFNDNTNVGIGTSTPGAKLDVAGTVKITDGTQGAGKVLTSDANGLATWATPAAAPYYHFTGTAFGQTMSFPVGDWGAMLTVAMRENCIDSKTATGTIYYDVVTNTVSMISGSANPSITPAGNVLTLNNGCVPMTFTFTVTGGNVTITVGGDPSGIMESKWTVLGI